MGRHILKPRLPLVRVPGMFLQDGSYLLDCLRILLLKNFVGDDPREHVSRDVPGRGGKGQYSKREKYKGYDQCHGSPAMPYPRNKGEQKTLDNGQ